MLYTNHIVEANGPSLKENLAGEACVHLEPQLQGKPCEREPEQKSNSSHNTCTVHHGYNMVTHIEVSQYMIHIG